MYDNYMSEHADLTPFEALAGACKALSHPARLSILQTLAHRGTCICGEIVDALPLSQATVSQHLKILKEAGLITGVIDGPRSCYCLDTDALRQLRSQLEQVFRSLDDCC